MLVRLAASLDGAVLGLGTAAVAVASWVKYLAVSGQLRLVASAATASVADARSLLPGDGDEPRIAAVRGYVRTQGSFLRAPFSGEAGVVVKHTQMVKPLDQTVYKEDYRVGEVARPELTGHSNDTVADASMNSQPSLSIALLDEEKRLPIGKKITAIGLCRAKNAESVEITSCPEIPFFLSELTKDEMQAQLASRARILFWGSIVLGTLSVCLVGHTIYRGWKRIKLWREAR